MSAPDNGWDAVHFFVPTVYPGDGIGGHTRNMAAAQRARGRRSEIFVQLAHPQTAHLCRPADELDEHVRAGERTVLCYQTGTGSTLPSLLTARSEPLVVQHQGLTPVELLAPWSSEAVGELTLGRRQLEALAGRADLGIGTSSHNARELEALGFRRTAVAPVMLAPPPPPTSWARPVGVPATVLFVGRITPNKAQHDLIEALAVLRVRMPTVRLRLVGSTATPRYRRALDRLVTSLGLEAAVTFVGPVDDDVLAAEYRRADVFCCLSDHEGFGMPLVEAAGAGTPVIAYDAAATAETVGGGGIVLAEKSPATVATAIERVLTDDDLRSRLVLAGHARRAELATDRVADAFDAALAELARELAVAS